jgi:hypothetical protein
MVKSNSNKKPRIAVIGLKGLPAYGGSARAGENMVLFLKDRYHFVVFNTDTHTQRESGVYDGVEQIVFKKLFIPGLNTMYYYLLSTFYCLFNGGFDVVHVFHVDAAFIVPLLRLRYRVVSGHRAKGIHVMLEALTKLNYPGKVLIIGNRSHSPDYSRKLEVMAGSLDVRFIDIIKEKPLLMAYLKNAKMFIFPSFHEGMSNMLLEAVSARIPVICSDIPENTQVFDEGEVLFFKTGDSDDLSDKVKYVAENEEAAADIAEKGYTRLRRDYDWTQIAGRFAAIYDWLIENKKPLKRGDHSLQGKYGI